MRHPPHPRLFPYTTLFRSLRVEIADVEFVEARRLVWPKLIHADHAAGARAQGRAEVAGPAAEIHHGAAGGNFRERDRVRDRKSTRLNSSHLGISYAVFCLN